MKKYIALFATILLVPFAAHAEAKVGEPAPEFSAVDSTGKSHNLADLKGKLVVLEWTNAECPFVVKHYKSNNMQELQKQYTDKGVVWLSVNSSATGKQGHLSPQEAQALIKEQESNASAFLLDDDGSIGKSYGARTTPHMFVIDKKGVLAYAGAIDSNSSARPETIEGAENYVSEALDSLMAGKSVKTTSSEPYGCSVKYQS